MKTDGASPTLARTDGKDKIPREMVSAIMTGSISLAYVRVCNGVETLLMPACLLIFSSMFDQSGH